MASEFFLLASLVLIGIVFFSVFQIYTITQSEETKKAEIKAEAERIASLAYKISKDPSKYMQYCLFTLLSNITVENGLLRYESSKYKFTLIIPKEIENSQIFETTKVCFVKRDSKIVLSREVESCNLNGVCELEECKINCPDCYGPNNNCLNDNFCNLNIGENCKNSLDCSCRSFEQNYACCPENPSSNKYGCFYLPNKKEKGEECYCDEECDVNLKCNPVDPSFTSYKKACCEEGKSWNGKECVSRDVFDIFIVPVQVSDQNRYLSVAISFKNHFLSVSPFKECKNKEDLVKFWIINISDCPSEAASSCSTHFECISIGRKCARKMENKLGVNYDKFVVLTNGGDFLGGIACNIPCDGSSSNLITCSYEVCVPSHEIGHTLGLGHVSSSYGRGLECEKLACHACSEYYSFFGGPAPNCPDCSLPNSEKVKFIMDYCPPMESYGPAGYEFLKNNFLGTSPHAAGLGRWMKGCLS
jgi:hypothetical protein